MKKKDMFDKYNRLPYNYQSRIRYDTLIQNVIPQELISLMGATIVDRDIKLKLKTSRMNNLESRIFSIV